VDKYDEAIAYLTAHPDRMSNAWVSPTVPPAGCLFAYLTPTGLRAVRDDGMTCGCPTMVKARPNRVAWTEELTAKVKADNRIPSNKDDLTLDTLVALAAYQREADRTFRRPAVAGEAR
jgi:hypothetical protein